MPIFADAADLALGIAALWIAVGAALAIHSARRLRRAERVLASARTMQTLLRAAPYWPLWVRPDGSVEADSALLGELGIDGSIGSLLDLSSRSEMVAAIEVEALANDVAAASLTGGRVQRQLHLVGSGRVLEVLGGPAPLAMPAGTMLLWFSDISATERDRSALAGRLAQTESALDSLTHLIESAPFPMWYRGPDLTLGLVNSAFVAAVEARDAAEVIARGSELIDATGDESARSGALVALESGQPHARTQPATIGGERRMLKLVDVPLPTGAVAGFAIDIQDLEDSRIELARHVESQRELADRMTAGVAQFEPDRSLGFYNSAFAVMAGLDPEWLAERPEFDRVIERMREVGRLPEVRDFPAWKGERRGWFTSADELIEEDWILANGDHMRVVAQPLPDGGLRLFFEDRTEQVRLASARDTLLRVRAATFDNLFEIISVFASDGRLAMWNRRFSQMWELDENWLAEHPRVDELVPGMARKLVNPTAAAQIRELVRSTTSGRQSGTGRLSMTDGRHFDFAAVPLPDGNALFTMVDVTDSSRIEAALRERAKALEEADRVKTDFVANMSYELRTPLTSIGGFAEMLAQGYAGKLAPAAADYVGAILESVERLSNLINNVLDLTHGDTQGVALEHERVDVAGLCRAAVQALAERAAERRQEVRLVVAPDTGHVFGDSRRLRESVEHVLRNAVVYSPEETKVTVEASGTAEDVIIKVRDEGPGIAEEERAEVFKRFHRAPGVGARGDAALGLGLPLTRQFIEAHGGSVELGAAPGGGTEVVITVPRGR